jgi:hypothetical protein
MRKSKNRTLAVVLCFLVFCGGIGRAGLIAYYNFGTDSPSTANLGSAGSAADGVLMNGAQIIDIDTTSRGYEWVLRLSNDDNNPGFANHQYMNITNGDDTWYDTAIGLTLGARTYAAWVRMDTDTTQDWSTIMSKGFETAVNLATGTPEGNGMDQVVFSHQTGFAAWSPLKGTVSVMSNTYWSHVAATIDGEDYKTGRLYINGVLQESRQTWGPLYQNDLDLLIGAEPNRTAYDFGWNGMIDEVRIYDEELSEENIQSLYTNTNPGDVHLALDVSPLEMNFLAEEGGSNPPSEVLSIWNCGTGTLDWNISEDCNWLTAVPDSGTSFGEFDYVDISVDISGLSGGIYNCQMTVTAAGAENSPQVVDVELIVGPKLEVTPMTFDFSSTLGGSNPAPQILEITNGGAGTLTWEATEDCGWLEVDPNSGTSTGEVDYVNVTADISGLGGGTYNSQITVTGVDANNSPQVVDVELVVQVPIIGVSSTSFDFFGFEGGANPAAQTLSISNAGEGSLQWEISEECGWLTAEPNTGTCTGEVDDVTLSVDTSGLAAGEYNCELTVSDPNALNNPVTVDVNLVINTTEISVSETEFEFFSMPGLGNPNDQIVSISNSGTGTLNWEIIEDCNWLTAEPNTGTCTSEVDDVNLSVNISGLASGYYDCELLIFGSGAINSPQSVFVTLVIGGEGELHVPGQYSTIQSAIDAAVTGDRVIVADETYTGSGNYNIDFRGKSITLESWNGPESCIIDCGNLNGRRGFYFHSGEDSNSVVCGFTIKRGRIYSSNARGGGIYCGSNSHPMFINCVITDNRALGSYSYPHRAYGGGLYCTSDSSPTIINCTFSNNTALGDRPDNEENNCGDAYGGGIYCQSGSNPTIKNCLFYGNTATGGDGVDYYCIPMGPGGQFCWFGGCGGDGLGGGIFCDSGTIENCTIYGNLAIKGLAGDAALGDDGTSLGGGVYGNIEINNCILWGNIADNSLQIHGSGIVSYSDVEGGFDGTNNIDSDPLFVTGVEGDYYLSQAASGQGSDSPCVDAGSDTAANLGMDEFTTRTDHRVDEGVVDMGYHYGYYIPMREADINGDYCVNFVDYAILVSQWFDEPGEPSADISPYGGDGIVDTNDLGVLVDFWLECHLSPARRPFPSDNEASVKPNVVLNWWAGFGAVYHDVYLGTNFDDVNDATIESSEYMGNFDVNSYDPCGLDIETTYYWRVDEENAACGIVKGAVWSFTTMEMSDLRATNPEPSDAAEDVNPYTSLSWTAGYGAISHDVYLGINAIDVDNATVSSDEYMGNFDVNSYDPCGLDFGAIYYWRIDEENVFGTAKGDVWSFTTVEILEFKAFDPDPPDGAEGVDPNTVLSWSVGIGAISHDVYLGTDFADVNDAGIYSDEYKGNYDVNSYDPCGLDIGTFYYWRIDEENATYGMVKGTVWSFRTMKLEFMASNPDPAEGVSGVDPNTVLSWSAGIGVLSHDVYLGTSWFDVNDATVESSEYMGNFDINSYDPCGLDIETTYYWRIDEEIVFGTVKGDVWSFTTIDINSGLSGWWEFEEGSGGTAYDSSGNGNDGILVGQPDWVAGAIGGGVDCNGTGDYISIPSIAALEGSNVTIAAWINGDNFQPGGWNFNPIVTQYNSFREGYYLYVRGDDNKPALYLSVAEVVSTSTINTGQWYHIGGTYDNNVLKIYINGDLKNTLLASGINGVGHNCYIGYDQTDGFYFDGLIDDVRIYDRALSAGEIWALYQAGL